MITAVDMIGTNSGSGTKTYNLNFCKFIQEQNISKKIYIFISQEYLNTIGANQKSNIHYIVKPIFLKNAFLRILWMQFFLPFELKKLKVNQLFSPMNIGPIFIRFFGIRLILGLHSNLPWVYFSKMPGNFFRKLFTKLLMEISIHICDRLIVNSKFAKDEIVKFVKIKEEKIFVVYLGIDKKFLNNEKNTFYLNEINYQDYILSIMSCVRYHNILNLLKAFKLLKKETNLNIKYILVLQILDSKYFHEIKNFVTNNFSHDEIILLHEIENKYLVNLYKYAKFYVFSSDCEVFGLTSLEAMSQGCPVLISNKSALVEINSDAVEYFNPDMEDEIKLKMLKILDNFDYRKKLIKKGNHHFKKFSWDQTVKETIKILFN